MKDKSNVFFKFVIVVAILIVAVGFVRERFYNNDSTKSGVAGKQKNVTMQSLVGKPAPAFKITDRQGKAYSNESLKGKKVVLFFNEGLACYPACWEQMKQLSSDSRLNNDDTITLSVVTDSIEGWQGATAKTSELAAIKVAFDQGAVASEVFGTISAPSSMHGGVPGHSYVVIDTEGVVRFVLDDPKMGINNEKINSELLKIQ
ncbi:MAG: hypothetical protein US82_C0017G0003 [Parcubacteria group bacterium GW2011_GWC1_38_22]|nr:MAG: hypothetical protein US82_C0017G0003 [Parcubacteria group bacterium GW2011_GWC1_38_22]